MEVYSITLETLRSKLHNEKAIEKGLELWKRGKVDFEHIDGNEFRAQIADKDEIRVVFLTFSMDKCDLEQHYCHCRPGRQGAVCKHIVAVVLAIQGGVAETEIFLGKTASIEIPIVGMESPLCVGKGCDAVLTMSALVSLMEKAACAALEDELDSEQISVGASISVVQMAASTVEALLTATATITSVSGRRIEFALAVNDKVGEIACGTHSRIIVGKHEFLNAKENES